MMDIEELCSLCELYALGGLRDGERAAFEEHLAACAHCQAEYAELSKVAEFLLYDGENVAVPEGMRERVLTAVFAQAVDGSRAADRADLPPAPGADSAGAARTSRASETLETAGSRQEVARSVRTQDAQTPAAAAPLAPRSARRRRHGRVPAWLASAVAAIVTFAVVQGFHLYVQPPSPVGQTVATARLKGVASAQPQATATLWVTQANAGSQIVMRFQHLAPTHGKEAYQVWLVRGDTVYSAGVFRPNPSGEAVFSFLLPSTAYEVVAVTLEPQTIDQMPKGPKILVGSLNV